MRLCIKAEFVVRRTLHDDESKEIEVGDAAQTNCQPEREIQTTDREARKTWKPIRNAAIYMENA